MISQTLYFTVQARHLRSLQQRTKPGYDLNFDTSLFLCLLMVKFRVGGASELLFSQINIRNEEISKSTCPQVPKLLLTPSLTTVMPAQRFWHRYVPKSSAVPKGLNYLLIEEFHVLDDLVAVR